MALTHEVVEGSRAQAVGERRFRGRRRAPGLEQVAGFKKLTHLEIVNTVVTDKGLAHLKGLKSLTFLKVGGTMVTATGLAEFHEAVPGCKIDKDGVIIEPKK